VKINVTWQEATNKISVHAHHDLEILNTDVVVTQFVTEHHETEDSEDSHNNEDSKESGESKEEHEAKPPTKRLTVKRVDRLPKKPIFIVHLTKELQKGAQCEVEISFKGVLWETAEGLFRGSYVEKSGEKKYYLATHFRPNTARRLFPCFDEPSYKVPFTVSVSRPRNYTVLFNTPLKSSEDLDGNDYVVDHFETTPPISTYTLGFLISDLTQLETAETSTSPMVRIWSRPELQESLKDLDEKIAKTLTSLKNYWGVDYPLAKLDIVALPGLTSVKPVDNWGLILFK
jgi:aminopeptidase N